MIKSLEFKRVYNESQSNLRNDITQIRESNNLFVLAGKSRNIYKVSKASYERMIHENATKKYKKCNSNKFNSINFKAKQIASKLKIDDRVRKLDENEAYVTIKDHKEGFPEKISLCLINPSKTDIGRISKQILDSLNNSILEKNKLNQWKNMSSVVEWYGNIKRKDQCSFAVFVVESFYPPISAKLLNEALSFAKLYYNFTSDELEIIMHSRKTLLFWQDSTWVKKEDHEDFDIPMGCYDFAEICELVLIYTQNKLCKFMNKKHFGLYRDDGLGILRNTSGPEADQKRKNIIKIFKECWLSITCEINVKIVDFLDVWFNLNDQIYKPYRKSNNEPIYIYKQSNHPANIIADIPKAISKHLANISCNKNVFDRNVDIYQAALKDTDFDVTIIYNDQSEQSKNVNIEEANQARKRKRAIIWYNLPYSMNVKTNIGKHFLNYFKNIFPRIKWK